MAERDTLLFSTTEQSMPQPPIQPVNDDDKLEFLPMYEMLPDALGRGGLTYQPRVTYVIREKPPQSYE